MTQYIAPAHRVMLHNAPPSDALDHVTGQKGGRIALGKREIYVHDGVGMADSRLKIAAAKIGTVRNMHTVARLAAMATE